MDKTLVIDLRMINHSGIGIYLQSIIKIVLDRLSRFEIILLLDDKIDYSKYLEIDNFRTVIIKSPVYSLFEQIEIPFKIRESVDLYWSPHYTFPLFLRANFLLTIHDIYHYKDKSFNKILRRLYCWIFLKYIEFKPIPVICVSNFTKAELMNNFNIKDHNIYVIHNGIDEIWKDISDYKKNNIILCVGSNKKHKNIDLLIRAFKKISKKSNYKLYLIGKYNYSLFNDNIKNIIKEHTNIVFLPFVNKFELLKYYNKARLFVFPSLYEGFGLPPLEAISCGCPVILSNIKVLKEINGDAAYYFNNNLKSLVDSMNVLLQDFVVSDKIINDGMINIKKYSYKKCAVKTSDVINNHLSL